MLNVNMNPDCFVLPLTGDLTALRNILLYHFSSGIFINGGLEGGVTNLLKTFQGHNLQVKSVCHPLTVSLSLIILSYYIIIESKMQDWQLKKK